MADDAVVTVDATYRGLVLGTGLTLRELGPCTGYLEHGTPMPVGAPLELVTSDGVRIPVVVLRVHEQVAAAERPPGMRVRLGALDAAAARWWRERGTGQDPDIPGGAAAAETPAASDAAERSRGRGAGETRPAPEVAAALARAARPAAALRETQVMPLLDIDELVAESEGAQLGLIVEADRRLAASRTIVMTAQQIEEATGTPQATEAAEGSGPTGGAGGGGGSKRRRGKRRR